ncbi:MAG: HD-GYP domain-containing protein [Bacillota bacterium]
MDGGINARESGRCSRDYWCSQRDQCLEDKPNGKSIVTQSCHEVGGSGRADPGHDLRCVLGWGTKSVWPYAYYAAIVVGAYWYQLLGGVFMRVVCGLATGPFMPLSTVPWHLQRPASWLTRIAFFSAPGFLFGCLVNALKGETNGLRASSRDLTLTTAKLEEAHEQILRSLTLSIDTRDLHTRYHSDRVARYAMVLGKALGLSDREVSLLGWAGLMHDVGKVGVSEHILGKPGRLNAEEKILMQQHPVFSARIIEPVEFLSDIVDGVLHHHERMNGSGYPDSLKGDEIPWISRIVAVADVYEALTADRPYREAWPKERAAAYIIEHSGSLFEPHVVEAFRDVYRSFPASTVEVFPGGISFRGTLDRNREAPCRRSSEG